MRPRAQTVSFLITAVSAAAAALAPASAVAGSSAASLVLTGNAWGTYVKVGQIAKSGHTALAVLGVVTTATVTTWPPPMLRGSEPG